MLAPSNFLGYSHAKIFVQIIMASHQESKLTAEQIENIKAFAKTVENMSEERVKETLISQFTAMIYMDAHYKPKLAEMWRIKTEQA
jgi:hypothetical protein